MALTPLQREVMASIAKNRSETSYVAGGLVLNMDWPRRSDDIDIFHDTDEEIVASADLDMNTLRLEGFHVDIEVRAYGIVESKISKASESTLIQWMSETRMRFFPLVRDPEWGARLHRADLVVNKVLAASTRTKARDFVDLITIEERFCPLGAVIMAAAGKPPNYSPVRTVDEIRRRGLSIPAEDYESVKGLPDDLTATAVRERLVSALDEAEAYLRSAPPEIVGLLAIDGRGVPVEVRDPRPSGLQLRRATSEPESMPSFPDTAETLGF